MIGASLFASNISAEHFVALAGSGFAVGNASAASGPGAHDLFVVHDCALGAGQNFDLTLGRFLGDDAGLWSDQRR